MNVTAVLTALLLIQIQSVHAESHADDTYNSMRKQALTPGTSKSYRKKGHGDVKPASASSGEHGGRRFRGEEQIAPRQNPSSDVLIGQENLDPTQTHEPIFGESNVSQEKMPYMSADFEKWEMRPFEKDENALTKEELELIKAHYEKSEASNQKLLISR